MQLQQIEATHLKRRMGVAFLLVVLATTPSVLMAIQSYETADAEANPVRKVVTMLQKMQNKVTAEGEREKQLYEKYNCWCRNGKGTLVKTIAGATTKIPQVQSDIEAGKNQLTQLKGDLKQHQTDRESAKAAIAEAAAIREKEAASFAAEKAEYDANIDALSGAISAISKGMVGGFLQSGAAQRLRVAVLSTR